MPFKSEKQRRLLWAKHPEIAEKWAHEGPNKGLPMRVAGAHIPGAKIPRMACGGTVSPEKERVAMLLLPRHAEGNVAEPSHDPSLYERLKNFLMGSGVLKKLSSEAGGPPKSPEQIKLEQMQAKQQAEEEDRKRESQGLPKKVRVTPGFSKQ